MQATPANPENEVFETRLEEFTSWVESLTVDQCVRLVRSLEGRLGVKSSVPLPDEMFRPRMAPVPGVCDGEKYEFGVRIIGITPNSKISVIKEVRNLIGCGLKEAKDISENLPAVVLRGVEKAKCEQIMAALRVAGAVVEAF